MSELGDLFVKWGTDKGVWGYTSYYERAFAGRREAVRNVLEVGICGYRDIPNNIVGASLFVWRDYFPNAQVWGVDNDERFVFDGQPRIGTYLCDAYSPSIVRVAYDVLARSGWSAGLDFVCDDAVHEPEYQIQLLRVLWPFVAPGGVYAVEELCQNKVPDADFVRYFLAMMPSDGRATMYPSTHADEFLLLVEKAP